MVNISVIMTCRNEENYIKETLESLESQTIKPIETVIVDDASNDNTYYIIEEISKRSNWKIFRREKNDDSLSSIINSLKIASSLLNKDYDYIMVLDGDTVLEPSYIEKILEKFKENPKLGIAGGSLKNDEMDVQTKTLGQTMDVFGCNRIYSKKCWIDINEGNTMKVNSLIWDPEHSAKAIVRRYVVKRFDDVMSYALRPPRLEFSPYVRGRLSYSFGHSFFRTFIYSFLNRDLSFLSGYLVALINNDKKIDSKEKMKFFRNMYDVEYIKMLYSRIYKRIKFGKCSKI